VLWNYHAIKIFWVLYNLSKRLVQVGRGGFRPRATRAMARGSAQNFFFQLFRTGPAQHRGGGFYLTVRPCLSPVRPNPDAASPARQYATTRIRGSAPTPSPQPPPASATADGKGRPRPSGPASGARRRAQEARQAAAGASRQAVGPCPPSLSLAGARRQPAGRRPLPAGGPSLSLPPERHGCSLLHCSLSESPSEAVTD